MSWHISDGVFIIFNISNNVKIQGSDMMNRIDRKKNQILSSECYRQCSSLEYKEIICLGLGPLNRSSSQWQLALLLTLMEIDNFVNCNAFDPIFDLEDIDILQKYNISNKELYTSTKDIKTLFYMPHCEYKLMEDILESNLSNLENIVIFGTSYDSIRDKRFYNDLKSFAPLWTSFVNTIEDTRTPIQYKFIETPLVSEDWIDPHAFNDTCLFTFIKTSL